MADEKRKFIEIYRLFNQNGEREERLQDLIGKFDERSGGCLPDFIVCSPGRVNLIGDHVDYHGFSVLPMAIEKEILLAISIKPSAEQGKGTLEIMNTNQVEHADAKLQHSFANATQLERTQNWFNYVLCAYHGVMAKQLLGVPPSEVTEHARRLASEPELLEEADKILTRTLQTHSLKILIDSNLPIASGLSSSSALVCGAAVASSFLLQTALQPEKYPPEVDKFELADDCSKFERLVGVHGGGMDQAVIMTASQDFAKYIEFLPKLTCTDVGLPRRLVWLVSHSGVKYPKAATFGYNTRVLETKLAAAMIIKAHKKEHLVKLDKTITLASVKEVVFGGFSIEQIIDNLRSQVFENQNIFSVEQICNYLQISRLQLIERFNTSEEFLTNQLNNQLHILDRCEHVFEEAERVERFKNECQNSSIDAVQLGKLMTESHESLKTKYDCSHPALDKLVSVALDAGALGARLTGAGWGGCTVTLVEVDKYEDVMERLNEVSKFTFETVPQMGCHVIKVGK